MRHDEFCTGTAEKVCEEDVVKGLIVDLNGTLYFKDAVIEGAPEVIEAGLEPHNVAVIVAVPKATSPEQPASARRASWSRPASTMRRPQKRPRFPPTLSSTVL